MSRNFHLTRTMIDPEVFRWKRPPPRTEEEQAAIDKWIAENGHRMREPREAQSDAEERFRKRMAEARARGICRSPIANNARRPPSS